MRKTPDYLTLVNSLTFSRNNLPWYDWGVSNGLLSGQSLDFLYAQQPFSSLASSWRMKIFETCSALICLQLDRIFKTISYTLLFWDLVRHFVWEFQKFICCKHIMIWYDFTGNGILLMTGTLSLIYQSSGIFFSVEIVKAYCIIPRLR